LPPTPNPANAKRIARAGKDGEPPAERPKTPVMKRVILKQTLMVRYCQTRGEEDDKKRTNRRPNTSEPTPQTIAPTSRPALSARLRNGALKPNSDTAGERIRPVRRGQTESAK
jgi:hypothetical protein